MAVGMIPGDHSLALMVIYTLRKGLVSQQGVVLPQGFTVDLAKQTYAHDVPGQDVTLTGNNVWSRDPFMPYLYLTETGAFKPFGVLKRLNLPAS
jgi:hypothetical protein